jgi:hypothetical protein
LDQLLSLLATGGVHTRGELATRLGVTEGLLDQMLTDLSRMGYLRSVSDLTCRTSPNGHPVRCAGCPLSGTCAIGEPGGRVWALRDRDER